jgi:hypothetical protein
MDVLATRNLTYLHDSGKETEVTLTVFVPVLTERGDWKCEFQFSPPNTRRAVHVYGVDFIQALLGCLGVARGYVEHPTEDRTSWQGMSHSGLPWHQTKPEGYQPPPLPTPEENPGTLDILTTGRLGIANGDNDVRELVLVVYRPICSLEGTWKCAFAFGTAANESVRYGVGVDFIEAFLDALVLARVAYEAMVPARGEHPESSEFEGVRFLPFKVGREYAIERLRHR